MMSPKIHYLIHMRKILKFITLEVLKKSDVKISASLSMEAKGKYLALLKAYKDVFAWSYNELKIYDTSLIEHNIPLKLVKHSPADFNDSLGWHYSL